MFQVSGSFIFMMITLIIIAISVPYILYFTTVKSMLKQIDNLSQLNYTLMKKTRLMDDEIIDLSQTCETTQKNITSLSTSIDLVMRDIKRKSNEKYYPTPELARMIEETIREHVAIEFALIKDMRIPKKVSIENIVNIVSQTYPHISIDYITKKTLAFMETISSNNQQQ